MGAAAAGVPGMGLTPTGTSADMSSVDFASVGSTSRRPK